MKSRVLAFPFLANPPEDWNTKYKGVIEFPGFHTTPDFDMAAAYALGKMTHEIVEGNDGKMYAQDYPVVVGLVIPTTFKKDIDYDAVHFVMEILEEQLKEVVSKIEDINNNEEIIDTANDAAESVEYQSEIDITNAYEIMSEVINFQNPLGSIIENERFPDMVRDFAETGTVPKDALMLSTQQFRYVEDIPDNTIVAVYYLSPVAEEVIEAQLLEQEDIEKIESKWGGFQVLDEDSWGMGFRPQSNLVYGVDNGGLEYHGTTYLRLRNAAPELQLPPPPSPPFINS